MRRWLALGAVTATAAGAALALAQGGAPTPAPVSFNTRPEVPGVARTLVPFGIETTPAGSRAWALGAAGTTTVVLQRAPGGGWTSAPLPATGRPVGGASAPQHAGEMSADGHGAVLLSDPEHPERQATLLTRAPGAAFAAAPDPGAALLADELLVGNANASTARALLAVVGGDGAATFVAPATADGSARAVLRFDADGWHREDIVAPALAGPIHPVALAAAGPTRAWMLATSGDRVVLLRRDAATPRWVPADLDGDNLLRGGALPAAVTKIEVAAPPADPLTVTTDGLWVDLQVTPAGATVPVDLTEHLTVTDPPPAGEPTPEATATPDATSTATATATASPTPTASATPAPAEPKLAVDGRWCDLPAAPAAEQPPVCDHPLGFTFAHGERGYRSVATAATPDAKFGTRTISAPVDEDVGADARARDAERQGGYAALVGDTFALREGIGDDGSSTTQAIAFAADGTGFTGGTFAFGAVTRGTYTAPREETIMPFGDAITSAATSPYGDGRVYTLSRGGGSMIFTPGAGWQYANSGLQGVVSRGRYAPLRAVAWPRPNLMIGGGAAGALGTVTADPEVPDGGFDFEPDPSQRVTTFDALPVEATVTAIACTPTDPLDCVAVGLDGLIVRGDGTNWSVHSLPSSAADGTDITGVAFDGRTPLLATTDGLYRGTDASGVYERDDDLRDRMRTAGLPAAVRAVATVDDGGVVVDGRFARDSATAPWRPTGAPLELHPFAVAAYRDGTTVRAIVSATPELTPLPEPLTSDRDEPPPEDEEDSPIREGQATLPPPPVDAVTLRETADGWVDLDRASFQRSGGRDLPETTPNTRVLLVDRAGSGLLLGGVSDTSTSFDPREQFLSGSATVRRLERGAVVPAPGAAVEAAETSAPAGSVRIAVGGHPACLDRCAGAGGQGYAPDAHLREAIDRVRTMVAAGNGPAALLIGGGRASLGGEPLDLGGARRYREATQGAGIPTYVLPGPGDLPGGGADAFAAAFASAAAPVGTAAAPEGVDASAAPQPERADGQGARKTFAFDLRAAAGTVRVIAIDNAGGQLEGGTDGAQARWLRDVMEQARGLGYPSVVIGSMPLDGSQQAKPAADAADEIALLAGHASAYVATAGVDDPLDQHFGGTLTQSLAAAPGGTAPLLVLQSSTLGYAPAQALLFADRPTEESFNRQTAAALMMIDVAVDRLDRQTGLAPVSVMSEPLLDGLSLDSGSTSVPLGWAQQLFAIATEATPQRYLVKPNADEEARPASPQRIFGLPLDQCRLWSASCSSQVPTDIAFTSSVPEVGRIVAARAATVGRDRRPEIVLDATGHVVDDPRGIFCPLGLGTTTVSVTALGQRVSAPVRVIPVPSFPAGDGESTFKATPIAPGTCGFPRFTRVDTVDEKPAPVPPKKPVPPSVPQPEPAPKVQHRPHPAPHPAPQPQPQPQITTPPPAVPAPLPPVEPAPTDNARPPVAPAAKPPLPAPPAPPQGLQVQQAPAPQVQVAQGVQHQEQRREEYAYEADQAAVAYAHPPSPLPWEIAGGIAVLALVMAGGVLAGRARRPALAPATAGVARRRA